MRFFTFAFRLIILVAAALVTVSNEVLAQVVSIDSVKHERVLIGPVERSAFQDSSWYRENYSLYKPQAKLIRQIDSLGINDSPCGRILHNHMIKIP